MLSRTIRSGVFGLSVALSAIPEVFGQEAPAVASAEAAATPPVTYTIDTGTRIPLALISSVSSKSSAPGDRIYLETAFPIVNGNHIVIPTGSYVTGTVTRSSVRAV